MTKQFGFALSNKNLDLFIEWLDSHIPTIIEYQRRNHKPKQTIPYWGATMHAFVTETKPMGKHEWRMQVSLYRAILPEVTPLIFEDGITVTNTVPNTYLLYIESRKFSDWYESHLHRARAIIQDLSITHGFYDHMVRIGWSQDRIREYEYHIIPSGIGATTKVRAIGSEEWVKLEDPDYDP